MFSYDKLVEWMNSDEAQALYWLARANPGELDQLLRDGMKFRAEGDPWGFFGVLMNLGPTTFENMVAAQGVATVLNKFPTDREWDMKVYLAEDYGYESGLFYLHDEQGRVVRSDVFGNVMYGSMLAHWGVDLDTALRGANLGTSAGFDAGKGNDPLDDEAVKFGYDLYKKYPNGLSDKQFYEEIAKAHLDGLSTGAP